MTITKAHVVPSSGNIGISRRIPEANSPISAALASPVTISSRPSSSPAILMSMRPIHVLQREGRFYEGEEK